MPALICARRILSLMLSSFLRCWSTRKASCSAVRLIFRVGIWGSPLFLSRIPLMAKIANWSQAAHTTSRQVHDLKSDAGGSSLAVYKYLRSDPGFTYSPLTS
jgi:hypothetical protein